MADKIIIKRGLKANLPVLDDGELAFCTDTNELFIGSESGNILLKGTSDGVAPANVTNLAATPSANSVALSWSPSADATEYEIWRDGVLVTSIPIRQPG
jgi:hypothetical protein